MTEIKVVPLGAGQDVGRSCIIVSLGGKNIMFDCGMHMGFNDDRRFPDFTYITKDRSLTEFLDCVIISHFHLDHCGALAYMTEMVGYEGPIYMTHPTKAICPLLLDDYRKITVEKKGETNFFTSEMIHRCMTKVKCVYLHQLVKVDDELEIMPYYAGHVLGAAIFHVRVGSQSVVYTGDYTMTPDRHLGAAWIDKCQPDLLITESTYATTIRDSKRVRERDFLEKVHNCVENGGKVLIPVFALGRAQELCILLESYWERMNLSIPIFFSTGLAEKANEYYKLFISWTNQKIKETFVERNMFDFKHIKPLAQGMPDNPGPMVVFATPGMLHSGQSLHIFRKWAPSDKNMVIIPGYCVAGTIGYKILNGAKKLDFDKQSLDVKLRVEYLSFSAHADAKGIMQLISQCEPKNVMLVHGESAKMDFLKQKIHKEFKLPCFKPANGELVVIETMPPMIVQAAPTLFKRKPDGIENGPLVKKSHIIKAGIVVKDDTMTLLERGEALKSVSLEEHHLQFTSNISVHTALTGTAVCQQLASACQRYYSDNIQHQEEGFMVGEGVTVLVKEQVDDDDQDSVSLGGGGDDPDPSGGAEFGSGGPVEEEQSSSRPGTPASDDTGRHSSRHHSSSRHHRGSRRSQQPSADSPPPLSGGRRAQTGGPSTGQAATFKTRHMMIHVTYFYPDESLGSKIYLLLHDTIMKDRQTFVTD